MFYVLLETILFFGLCYLHLDLFQFLHKYLFLHVQFCQAFCNVKLHPSSRRQCVSFDMYLEIHLAFTRHAISQDADNVDQKVKLTPHYSLLLCVPEHYSF